MIYKFPTEVFWLWIKIENMNFGTGMYTIPTWKQAKSRKQGVKY